MFWWQENPYEVIIWAKDVPQWYSTNFDFTCHKLDTKEEKFRPNIKRWDCYNPQSIKTGMLILDKEIIFGIVKAFERNKTRYTYEWEDKDIINSTI